MNIMIDSLLALLAIYLAFQSLMAPRLTQSVFLFFAFGLTLALAWVRLGAVDVAITEAAIASGFLGVLFLDALGEFTPAISAQQQPPEAARKDPRRRLLPLVALAPGLLLFLLLALEAIWKMPPGGGLAAPVGELLPRTGVEHPVTAVLLNFRGYDTWLEIGVILMGLLAVYAIGAPGGTTQPRKPVRDPMLRQAILFFTPILFLFGAFLLYIGKSGPGGAFQAAVLWGAIGILLHLGGWPLAGVLPRWLRQLLLVVGPGFFLVLGLVLVAAGSALFEYPEAYAGILILGVETFAAISIAAALTAIFAGSNQMRQEPNDNEPTT